MPSLWLTFPVKTQSKVWLIKHYIWGRSTQVFIILADLGAFSVAFTEAHCPLVFGTEHNTFHCNADAFGCKSVLSMIVQVYLNLCPTKQRCTILSPNFISPISCLQRTNHVLVMFTCHIKLFIWSHSILKLNCIYLLSKYSAHFFLLMLVLWGLILTSSREEIFAR